MSPIKKNAINYLEMMRRNSQAGISQQLASVLLNFDNLLYESVHVSDDVLIAEFESALKLIAFLLNRYL